MAKAPTTRHAKAIAAYILGDITRREYQLCCQGYAWISGRSIVKITSPWSTYGIASVRHRRFDNRGVLHV